MKLGPKTKLDKRNLATSKNFDDGAMSRNCDVIVVFPIYGQFLAIQKPDSGRMVYKTCRLPKTALNGIFFPFYLTEKHQICILYQKIL